MSTTSASPAAEDRIPWWMPGESTALRVGVFVALCASAVLALVAASYTMWRWRKWMRRRRDPGRPGETHPGVKPVGGAARGSGSSRGASGAGTYPGAPAPMRNANTTRSSAPQRLASGPGHAAVAAGTNGTPHSNATTERTPLHQQRPHSDKSPQGTNEQSPGLPTRCSTPRGLRDLDTARSEGSLHNTKAVADSGDSASGSTASNVAPLRIGADLAIDEVVAAGLCRNPDGVSARVQALPWSLSPLPPHMLTHGSRGMVFPMGRGVLAAPPAHGVNSSSSSACLTRALFESYHERDTERRLRQAVFGPQVEGQQLAAECRTPMRQAPGAAPGVELAGAAAASQQQRLAVTGSTAGTATAGTGSSATESMHVGVWWWPPAVGESTAVANAAEMPEPCARDLLLGRARRPLVRRVPCSVFPVAASTQAAQAEASASAPVRVSLAAPEPAVLPAPTVPAAHGSSATSEPSEVVERVDLKAANGVPAAEASTPAAATGATVSTAPQELRFSPLRPHTTPQSAHGPVEAPLSGHLTLGMWTRRPSGGQPQGVRQEQGGQEQCGAGQAAPPPPAALPQQELEEEPSLALGLRFGTGFLDGQQQGGDCQGKWSRVGSASGQQRSGEGSGVEPDTGRAGSTGSVASAGADLLAPCSLAERATCQPADATAAVTPVIRPVADMSSRCDAATASTLADALQPLATAAPDADSFGQKACQGAGSSSDAATASQQGDLTGTTCQTSASGEQSSQGELPTDATLGGVGTMYSTAGASAAAAPAPVASPLFNALLGNIQPVQGAIPFLGNAAVLLLGPTMLRRPMGSSSSPGGGPGSYYSHLPQPVLYGGYSSNPPPPPPQAVAAVLACLGHTPAEASPGLGAGGAVGSWAPGMREQQSWDPEDGGDLLQQLRLRQQRLGARRCATTPGDPLSQQLAQLLAMDEVPEQPAAQPGAAAVSPTCAGGTAAVPSEAPAADLVGSCQGGPNPGNAAGASFVSPWQAPGAAAAAAVTEDVEPQLDASGGGGAAAAVGSYVGGPQASWPASSLASHASAATTIGAVEHAEYGQGLRWHQGLYEDPGSPLVAGADGAYLPAVTGQYQQQLQQQHSIVLNAGAERQLIVMAPQGWPASGASGPEGPLATRVAERLMTSNPLFRAVESAEKGDVQGPDSARDGEE